MLLFIVYYCYKKFKINFKLSFFVKIFHYIVHIHNVMDQYFISLEKWLITRINDFEIGNSLSILIIYFTQYVHTPDYS